MPDTDKNGNENIPDAKTRAIEAELERLKEIDPGADNPETRIRLEREWDAEHPA